jgi:hypothetical protein
MLRLRWAAYRSGYDALADALGGPIPVPPGFRSTPPHPPWGHPDLVLARAVADGVLTPTEAALIGATRLEEVPVADWAAEHQTGEWATYKARKRAEFRLAAYLRDSASDSDGTDPLTDQVATSLALTRPAAPVRDTTRPLLSAPAVEGGTEQKVRGSVSKRDPKSGVQGCGEHPRSTRSLEVPDAPG